MFWAPWTQLKEADAQTHSWQQTRGHWGSSWTFVSSHISGSWLTGPVSGGCGHLLIDTLRLVLGLKAFIEEKQWRRRENVGSWCYIQVPFVAVSRFGGFKFHGFTWGHVSFLVWGNLEKHLRHQIKIKVLKSKSSFNHLRLLDYEICVLENTIFVEIFWLISPTMYQSPLWCTAERVSSVKSKNSFEVSSQVQFSLSLRGYLFSDFCLSLMHSTWMKFIFSCYI